MTMDNLHDLFEHELKDIYDAESRLINTLRTQAAESTDPEVRAGFQKHLQETQNQKVRLEEVFSIWGKEASRGVGCPGIKGLLEEHDELKTQRPAPAVLDLFNLGIAVKVERYEISAYESLLRLASQMGLDEAADLLERNLSEEEDALDALQTMLDTDLRFDNVKSHAAKRDRVMMTRSRNK